LGRKAHSYREHRSDRKLDSGGGTVVMRSDVKSELSSYQHSIELLGVSTEIIEQKTIRGAKVS
jgi:hypothetical protein